MSVPASTAASKMYDLVVLGAGSGGLEAAWNSAVLHQAKVAVIEPQLHHGPPFFSALGGTCVNVGCIPKKFMYYAAEQRGSKEVYGSLGWSYDKKPEIDWAEMMRKKDSVISDINDSYMGMFKDTENLDLIQGWGVINSDAKSVLVYDTPKRESRSDSYILQAKNILISTGSWPFKPPFNGIEHTMTSNEFFYLREKPKKVVVVGGGYIAIEFVSILHGLGVEEIHLIYRGSMPLKGFDISVRTELLHQLRQREGIVIHLEDTIEEVVVDRDRLLKTVTTCKGESIHDISCVIICTGRRPRTTGIGLEDANITVRRDSGAVSVDHYNRTNIDRVWAVGDVTDRVSLTPVAIHEGRCVADSMFGPALHAVNHDFIPKAVFSIPPIASVGITEDEIINERIDAEVYMSKFTPLRYNAIPGSDVTSKALIKMIVRSSDKVVLGVHILESNAPEIIQSVAVCLRMQAKISDFYNTIGLHPSSAEELCSIREPSYYFVAGRKCEKLQDNAK